MAPQLEDKAVVATDASSSAQAPEGGSYWDAPPERTLQGKTLSTMDMATLSNQYEEETEEAPEEQKRQSKGGYWDWRESMKKSLSKLNITDLISQKDNQESDSNAEPRNFLQRNSSGRGLNEASSGSQEEGDEKKQQKPRRGSYWTWRNPSMKNLSNADLATLENAAQEADRKEGETAVAPESPSSSKKKAPSYWFWRNPSMKNLSSASLDTMEQTAKESDRMQGMKNDSEPGSPKIKRQGSITKMQHRLRNSWRKSFQKLSSNSLTKLSELNDDSVGRRSVKKDNGDEDLSVHDEEGEGALTF